MTRPASALLFPLPLFLFCPPFVGSSRRGDFIVCSFDPLLTEIRPFVCAPAHQEPELFLDARNFQEFSGTYPLDGWNSSHVGRLAVDLAELFSIFMARELPHVKWFATGGALIGALRNARFMPFDKDIDVFVDEATFNSPRTWQTLLSLPGARRYKNKVHACRDRDGCLFVPVGAYGGVESTAVALVLRLDFRGWWKFRVVDMRSGVVLEALWRGFDPKSGKPSFMDFLTPENRHDVFDEFNHATIGPEFQMPIDDFWPPQKCALGRTLLNLPSNATAYQRAWDFTPRRGYNYSGIPVDYTPLYTQSMPGATCRRLDCESGLQGTNLKGASGRQRGGGVLETGDFLHVFKHTRKGLWKAHDRPISMCVNSSLPLPAKVPVKDRCYPKPIKIAFESPPPSTREIQEMAVRAGTVKNTEKRFWPPLQKNDIPYLNPNNTRDLCPLLPHPAEICGEGSWVFLEGLYLDRLSTFFLSSKVLSCSAWVGLIFAALAFTLFLFGRKRGHFCCR